MFKLPRKHAQIAFGLMQAGLTTAVASGISTYYIAGLGARFLQHWPLAWITSWMTMVPVVLICAPWLGRLIASITKD